MRTAEKSCKTNQLSLSDALAAFDHLNSDALHSAFAGTMECPDHYKYPFDCTVLQLVRITDRMTGLICDRQSVAPGGRTVPPRRISPNGLMSGNNPATSLNNAIQFFWPYLSDEDLDELHTQYALDVMGTFGKERDVEERKHKNRLSSAGNPSNGCSEESGHGLPPNLHAFTTVYQWALRIGYRPDIHSRESAAKKDMMTESERKWRTCYHPIIRKYQLKLELVAGYQADIYVAGVQPHKPQSNGQSQ